MLANLPKPRLRGRRLRGRRLRRPSQSPQTVSRRFRWHRTVSQRAQLRQGARRNRAARDTQPRGRNSLEALRWLTDAGIAFLQIDRDGEVIAASASYGLSDPRLRRALALATTNTAGLEIARFLLHAKIAGQERNLTPPIFANNVRAEVSDCLNVAKNARSIPEILTAEARGALAYWGAWKDVSLRFARKEEKSIPEYWRTFRRRRSPITDSPRLAANPANATLNYLLCPA